MGFSARDVIPFTQARANLSELADQAKAGAEKIITKARVNGKIYYRVAAAGLAEGSARSLCSKAKSKGAGCITYAANSPLPGTLREEIRVAAR